MGKPVAVIVVLDTVCDALTVQELPLPAVIVVPAVTPVPDMLVPITIVPDVTEVTVKVVPEIEPINTA
jgi:hypothetical protein